MSEAVFLDDFASVRDVIDGFWPGYSDSEKYNGELDDCEILLATYFAISYDGTAFVLYRKDGKLYEVNGSHCSCYGLEGQWAPEETTAEALQLRIDEATKRGGYSVEPYYPQLAVVLDRMRSAK